MIFFPALTDRTTLVAFAEVQQMSVSALTSAVEFTYVMTTDPGCRFFSATRSPAFIISAIGQPAAGSGRRTVFSGASIAAVSAMK